MEKIAQMPIASNCKNAGAYFGRIVSPPGHSGPGKKLVGGVDFRVAFHLDPEYRRKKQE